MSSVTDRPVLLPNRYQEEYTDKTRRDGYEQS
jgi:hypothetical protein